jgi:hypothetical protein
MIKFLLETVLFVAWFALTGEMYGFVISVPMWLFLSFQMYIGARIIYVILGCETITWQLLKQRKEVKSLKRK